MPIRNRSLIKLYIYIKLFSEYKLFQLRSILSVNSRAGCNSPLLLILTRSGAHMPIARAFVTELENQGVRDATPEIYIADIMSLRCLLETLERTMPPISGCIQSTMVPDSHMLSLNTSCP